MAPDTAACAHVIDFWVAPWTCVKCGKTLDWAEDEFTDASEWERESERGLSHRGR